MILAVPVESRLLTSYTVHMLSIPPQAAGGDHAISGLVVGSTPAESFPFFYNILLHATVPTKLPEGAKATDMTQEERRGMTCTLLPVQVSQMMSLPSREPETACLAAKI